MAPTAPTKRRTLRAKLAARTTTGPYEPRKAPRPDAVPVSDDFGLGSSTKKDKRHIKHSSFVSRIEKTQPGKALKRRRPGKKLKTNLDALADALPDLQEDDGENGENDLQPGRVRHRSLRTRKGALQRKEKLVRGEVERFGVSLARLNTIGATAGGGGKGSTSGTAAAEAAQEMQVESEYAQAQTQAQQAPSATSNRWAALRGFISATMEQNPAFLNKQDGK